MRKIFEAVLFMTFLGQLSLDAMTCEMGLQRLKEGNQRYVEDKLIHPDRTSERREALQSKQQPFAIIVGCSDSRVAPEIVFDQGVGDLFIVRVAGNVVGPIELDSIEYAAEYLKSCLIVVMGHQNCGAVDAVMKGKTQDIEAIAELIDPAIEQCRRQKELSLENCVKTNVSNVVKQLQGSPVIKGLIEKKEIAVIGGYYSLGTGQVEWLSK